MTGISKKKRHKNENGGKCQKLNDIRLPLENVIFSGAIAFICKVKVEVEGAFLLPDERRCLKIETGALKTTKSIFMSNFNLI